MSQADQTGDYAPEIPSKHHPPVPYRDMPDPLPLKKVLGPSVVAIAIGLASGEFILWPYITSKVGLGFLWAAILGLVTQYFVNMEIERYTLATGETAITGFSRFWRPWAIIFSLAAILPNLWPGWATSASTLFTFVIGGGNVVWISVISLIIMGIILTVSPVIYKTVEKIEFFKVGAVILLLAAAVTVVISIGDWAELGRSTVQHFGTLPDELPFALMLGAMAFAGAGGVHNLVISNWIRDKGFGMGAYIPRITSPFTGEDQAIPSTGYLFKQDAENYQKWKKWWKVANTEQFISFVVIGGLTIVIMSVLAYSTVFGQNLSESANLAFLKAEGEALGAQIGQWFQTFFYVIGAISLFAGNIGILDYVGRAVADALKTNYLPENSFWTESKIYSTVVWGEILFGILVLLSGLTQPLVLLIIASATSGVIMFVYCILLIYLNRVALPEPIRIRGLRLIALLWAVFLFGFLSVLTVGGMM